MESGISLQWIGRAMEQVGQELEPEGAAYVVRLLGERVFDLTNKLEDVDADDWLDNPGKRCLFQQNQPEQEGELQ
jgi:hypothetical protein